MLGAVWKFFFERLFFFSYFGTVNFRLWKRLFMIVYLFLFNFRSFTRFWIKCYYIWDLFTRSTTTITASIRMKMKCLIDVELYTPEWPPRRIRFSYIISYLGICFRFCICLIKMFSSRAGVRWWSHRVL